MRFRIWVTALLALAVASASGLVLVRLREKKAADEQGLAREEFEPSTLGGSYPTEQPPVDPPEPTQPGPAPDAPVPTEPPD